MPGATRDVGGTVTRDEAVEHLRARIRLMDSRYVAQWPKWTVADFAAASIAVRAVEELKTEVEQEKASAREFLEGV